jgi:hypothetical protein
MTTLLQIDVPTILDVSFGISFIVSGLVITGYILRLFYSKKVQL